MERYLYAAIDANINRALEGVRVCEDVLRFCLHRADISARIKEIRHRIADAAKLFPRGLLLQGRDVEADGQKFVDLGARGPERDAGRPLLREPPPRHGGGPLARGVRQARAPRHGGEPVPGGPLHALRARARGHAGAQARGGHGPLQPRPLRGARSLVYVRRQITAMPPARWCGAAPPSFSSA